MPPARKDRPARSSPRRPAPRGPARQLAKDRLPSAASYVYVFSRAAIRSLDQRAQRNHHIPAVVLMENAARHLADAALDLLAPPLSPSSLTSRSPRPAPAALRSAAAPSVLVLCGPGNNGADGLAAARHLANAGLRVCVVLAAPRSDLSELAAMHLRVISSMDVPVLVARTDAPENAPAVVDDACSLLSTPDLLIDALLGTGLSRPVTGTAARLVVAANTLRSRGVPILAADIPTGLDADTGQPLVEITPAEAAALRLDPSLPRSPRTPPIPPASPTSPAPRTAITADLTVTFVGLKRGFLSLSAQPYLGDVVIADIGAPAFLAEALGEKLPVSDRRRAASPRPPSPRARRGV